MLSTRVAYLTHQAAGGARRLKLRAKRRFQLFEPPAIVPFRGYGTPDRVFVSGRVLEADGVVTRPTGIGDSILRNLGQSLRRLRSDEIPGAKVRVSIEGATVEEHTDGEGYFEVELRPSAPLESGWHEVEVELLESIAGGEGLRATGEALVPPDEADFGVISDIDDTVVYTHATNRLKMIRVVLLQNAHTRHPFPGVGAFYRALKLGPTGRGSNPIFYVSRSPWNLYDLFASFFEAHDIPRGPLFLRDLRLIEPRSRELGGEGKLTRIRELMQLYPKLPFVLVGDSGQKDPEIYREVVIEHPGRVRAVYIRDITRKGRDREVHKLAEELAQHGVPMILTRESIEATRHAVEARLISPDALGDVAKKKRQDEARSAEVAEAQ